MLREVLRLIVARGSASCEDLARALDANPELVRLAIEDLERREYIRIMAAGGSTACDRCPLRAACLYRRAPRIWTVTRKGEALGRVQAKWESL